LPLHAAPPPFCLVADYADMPPSPAFPTHISREVKPAVSVPEPGRKTIRKCGTHETRLLLQPTSLPHTTATPLHNSSCTTTHTLLSLSSSLSLGLKPHTQDALIRLPLEEDGPSSRRSHQGAPNNALLSIMEKQSEPHCARIRQVCFLYLPHTATSLSDITTGVFKPPPIAAHPRAPPPLLPRSPPPPPPWPHPRPPHCLCRRRRHQSDGPHLQLRK
jgi:hypothetical protein